MVEKSEGIELVERDGKSTDWWEKVVWTGEKGWRCIDIQKSQHTETRLTESTYRSWNPVSSSSRVSTTSYQNSSSQYRW